jgi:hypothetical protein
MQRIYVSLGSLCTLILLTQSLALGADLTGTVVDVQQHPVAGVNILIEDATGKQLRTAVTDAKGYYEIDCVLPSTYDYVLSPMATGFKGGRAVYQLSEVGLRLDWTVSNTGDPVALGKTGNKRTLLCDPFYLPPEEFAAAILLGSTVVAGGVVTGVGASGGFSGTNSSQSKPPLLTSPSM